MTGKTKGEVCSKEGLEEDLHDQIYQNLTASEKKEGGDLEMAKENKKTSLQKEAEEFVRRLRSDYDEDALAQTILNGLSPAEKEQRKDFNPAELVSIFVLAGGTCQICGTLLGKNWYASHVVPLADGGETTVQNAIATCGSCSPSLEDC